MPNIYYTIPYDTDSNTSSQCLLFVSNKFVCNPTCAYNFTNIQNKDIEIDSTNQSELVQQVIQLCLIGFWLFFALMLPIWSLQTFSNMQYPKTLRKCHCWYKIKNNKLFANSIPNLCKVFSSNRMASMI